VLLQQYIQSKIYPKDISHSRRLRLTYEAEMQDGNWDDYHEGMIKTPFSIKMDVFIILTLCC